jgi:hypothetical protein
MIIKELIAGLLPNALFFMITMGYFILKYINSISSITNLMGDSPVTMTNVKELHSSLNRIRECGDMRMINILFPILYLVVVFIAGVLINFGMNANKCEDVFNNLIKIVWYVSIPLLTILVPIMCLVYKIKSWKSPFSNTMGLLYCVLFQGATGVIDTINDAINDDSKKLDIGNLPNDITEDMLSNIDNILPFYRILIAKDMVGEMCWYLLAGLLSAVVSFSLVTNIKCKYTENKINEDNESYKELFGSS